MKIRPLPVTDLARIAVLPVSLQRSALLQVKNGGGALSYEPSRRALPDIINRQPGPFPSERSPLAIVEAGIVKSSRSEDERNMNLLVTRSLYKYCVKREVRAVELDGYPISFSIGLKIVCWTPALFIYPDRLTVPFIDMRRKFRLSYAGETFIMSLQHLALRVNNPDYGSVELEILRLADSTIRSVIPLPEAGRKLYSYEMLESMIAVTYRIWNDVLAERVDAVRKSVGKGGSGLFD